MDEVEYIKHQDQDVAIVFRGSLELEGVKFFTNDSNTFQIGAHHQKKGVVLTPHIHLLENPIIVKEVQEYLFIQKGKMKITLYTKKGEVIKEIVLNGGDSVLLMREGHGIEFLEETRLMEVKQGPYPGTPHAKLYLKDRT